MNRKEDAKSTDFLLSRPLPERSAKKAKKRDNFLNNYNKVFAFRKKVLAFS